MALIGKTVASEFGPELTYWRLGEYTTNWLAQRIEALVFPWISEEYFKAGANPLRQHGFLVQLDGNSFDAVMASPEREKAIEEAIAAMPDFEGASYIPD